MTAARAAGLFLLLTALATAVSVSARLLADADQPTLPESFLAIIMNKPAYAAGGVARLASGLTLLGAAWFLWGTMAGYHRPSVGLATVFLAASGAVTAVSGACAVALAAALPSPAPDAQLTLLPNWIEPVYAARWITGKVGFTLAGLGLIALGPAQWRIGGALKASAVADVIIGAAMLLIWVDAATVMHRISGIAFLLWLIVSGLWLVAGLLKSPTTAAASYDSEGESYVHPR